MHKKLTYQVIKAEEQNLDEAASLMLVTGYWGVGLKNNNLGVSLKVFLRKYIDPLYFPFMSNDYQHLDLSNLEN